MRVAFWVGIPVVVVVLLVLLSKCTGVEWGFGITGAAVALLGSFVLIGDHFCGFRRPFNWVRRRYGAIEKGLDLLSGDLDKPCFLKEEQSGFEEILAIIAQRTQVEKAECSSIRYGRASAEGAVERVHVALCRGTIDSPQPCDTIGTKEVVEKWIHDDRLRSLSRLGFAIVFIGVVFGLVSLVMQAIASGNY